MNLIIQIFYNEGIFEELVKLVENAGISPYKWLEKIYESSDIEKFNELISLYIDETTNELWESKEDLSKFTKNLKNVKKFITGDYGNNLLAKYKALSLTEYFESACDVALLSIKELFKENSSPDPDTINLAEEIIRFKYLRDANIFDMSYEEYTHDFKYDINNEKLKLSEEKDTSFRAAQIMLETPKTLTFKFTSEQKSMIKSYAGLFGNDLAGLSKILSRVYLRQFFREIF